MLLCWQQTLTRHITSTLHMPQTRRLAQEEPRNRCCNLPWSIVWERVCVPREHACFHSFATAAQQSSLAAGKRSGTMLRPAALQWLVQTRLLSWLPALLHCCQCLPYGMRLFTEHLCHPKASGP